MIDSPLKTQLEKATLALDKTADIEGILIVAIDGRILHHNLRVDVDINLFGPMSQVISNSSSRLLNSSGQGEMERVLVESSGGKALFLGLENAHLIILMQNSANVGLVMVNAKRASEKINEATHDLELEVPEEVPVEEEPVEEITAEEVPVEQEPSEEIPTEMVPSEEIPVKEEITEEIPIEVPAEEIPVGDTSQEPVATEEASLEGVKSDETLVEETPGKELVEESSGEIKAKAGTGEVGELEEAFPETVETEPETLETELETPEEKTGTIETEPPTVEEPEETKPGIPSVKPPISFPTLPEHVEVPDNPEKRSELVLDIYEKIFLAMSMGAAKIMGVAPARGLTKQFLPFEKCPKLLHNVNLKSNATIDFAQIRKNAQEIPVPERDEMVIKDFSRMIEIITENYGRVMGYEAFRGMVRAEFLSIKKSYGDAMDTLNIKKNMHPEIAHLFN